MCENTYVNIQTGEVLDMEKVSTLKDNSMLKIEAIKQEIARCLNGNMNYLTKETIIESKITKSNSAILFNRKIFTFWI